MNKTLAFIVALSLAAPCLAQESVGIIIGPVDANGNLREIAALADPNASRVLKWNDSTNVIEWGIDASGGGGSGDVDSFAAAPTSNTNFSPATWRAQLGLTLDADVQRYDPDLAALSGGYIGIIKGLDDDNGFAAATLGVDYINNSSIDTSAELAAIVTNETGSGAVVFGTSPTLTTPSIASIVNSGTLTLPTSTDTLVGRATTDTLTNKTLTSPAISGGTINSAVIGGSAPAAGTFTNATVNGTLSLYDSVAAEYVDLAVEDSEVTYSNMDGVLPLVAPDEAYDATAWNGVFDVPTKNAVRDKIEAIVAGGGLGTNSIDTSAELAAIVTDETGSGALVFGTSPTISTPTLNGTPTLGSASGWRTALSLTVGTNVQAYDADLSTLAGVTPGATGLALLDDATASAARDTLGATSGVFPVTAGGTGFGNAPSGILKGASGIITTATAGTDYVAPDADLDDLADGTLTGSKVSGAVTVSGGTVDNTPIGATTPASGAFTSLICNDSFYVKDTGASVSGRIDYTNSGGWSILDSALSAADLTVKNTAYNATSWNGVSKVPTMDAVRDLAVTLQASDADLDDLADGSLTGSKVSSATTSAVGASELATSAETTTGSDTTRTITPDAYRGSDFGKRFGQFVCVGSATTLTTGDGKGEVFYRVPSELNGWNLVGVAAAVDTVSSSGTPTFQVRRRRLTSATATSDADMLSTAITIDASEFDSKDATTAAVINTSNDDVNTGDRIFADCDTAGTGTKGMSITLVFQKP